MKKQLFGLLMTTTLFAPTMTFAAEESMEGKQENTDAVVKAKLTENGGRNEDPMNENSEECQISGNTDLEKSWGYGYIPKEMNINGNNDEKAPLNDEGEQIISISSGNADNTKTHIGVKNKSRQTGAWRLTAKVDLKDKLGEAAEGITFNSKNSYLGERYKYKSSRPIADNAVTTTIPELTDRSNGGKITLNKDETELFTGVEGIVHNGFYNLQLRNCDVTIPNTRRIQNDDFQCNITWNLAQAPAAVEAIE